MRKWIAIVLTLFFAACIIVWQEKRIETIAADRDSYKTTSYSLMSEIKHYQTQDSLNAVSVGELKLTISELKRFRSDDMKLIESLKVDKKRLQQITTTQMQTIYELNADIKDSIVYINNEPNTLKCVEINEKWFDLNGCVGSDSKFLGKFKNRDTLLYIEHIIPKKFWFIKWGCKERRQEIVSRNPHTTITGAEFITIK